MRRAQHAWERLSDEQLLKLRLCDLKLNLRNSRLRAPLDQLYAELASRGIRFRPHVWFAEEWFSPDGVPGFAVPFYLAHPRLTRLEKRYTHEAEGSNRNWLIRILRHEAGHALDSAYRLRRRARWRALFGPASRRIRPRILPRPLQSGSSRTRTGDAATRTGQRYTSSNSWPRPPSRCGANDRQCASAC